MTVFVCSLFLPNTINFTLPTTSSTPRTRPSLPTRTTTKIDTSQPSLFAHRDLTPPNTPPGDGNDRFFIQDTGHFPKQEGPRSIIAPSDPHSPAWGSGKLFTQPKSRASSPPPANILKHNKAADRAVVLGRAGIRQPQLGERSDSHDRVFQHANWTVVNADQGNGGLRNAVQAAVRSGNLNEKIWVGTLGMPTDALEDTQQKQDIEDRLATEYDSLTVFCKDSDFDGHYTHYCKQILWPVFHYQIPDNPKSKAYEDHSWVYYVKVNQDFADKIVFRCLAVRKELLEGMLGANLIGFQIHEYARHFLQTCSRLLCVEATNDGVQLEDRFVDVMDLAIGIDPLALEMNRADPDVEKWLSTMQERYQGKKLIVARDKLDNIRGVRQKLLAYELFLNKYPEWRDHVVMIQVATSTTEQAELDATVSDIVTRVNSSWANLAYQPLVYLKQDISYPQYLALLTVADALMIASQREGMNLTCHEYLFCQDGKFEGHNKFGSLILSEFTGSASVFGGHELSVNPWDYRQCAEAIKKALEMGDEEKEARWTKLYEAVMKHTAEHWFTTFLARLDKAYDQQNSRDTTSVPRLSVNLLINQYLKSDRRLFILDYEGTLASWGSPHDIILTSPQRTLDVLNDILADERNIVYVMSGRQPEELDRLFKRVPGLGLIAENGCFLKEYGSSKWIEMADPEKMHAWQDSVEGIMQYYQERTPGSSVESRHCSLTFNYKNCEDQESASRQAGDCASHINDACEEQRVKAIPVEDAVIVAPIDWSKGTAATTIFEGLQKEMTSDPSHNPPIDFLMVVGDGRDDEVIFRWANELKENKTIKNVTTVSVGSRNTEAGFTLTQGVTGVLTVLQKLAQLPYKVTVPASS
ncbi:putative alpha,alpha-trehalose-phosphate synthase [UDP-forming] [Lachnellula cervina]|uniref:Putative alpha,alpha-trehalose-phosphate synthase [UDP-forming] n=1 Tax=Lachnellula cervina TaxID=1316786 RepID=A0A7D8UL10_9HELO|nr:putative alpha,alpha-trehalose-phosphate synthase [UDP-forming] [Lachnellula cervina]